MANPLASLQSNSNQPQSIVEAYKQFRNSFTGDPQQKINDMLNSGQVTQEQVNQATQLAHMVAAALK